MPRFSKKTMSELEANHAAAPSPLKGRLYLLVHNIRSLHNVGSIFRTADSFGVEELILSGYTPTPPDPRLSKTALGAEETVNWSTSRDAEDTLRKLKQQGVQIAALEQTTQSLPIHSFQPSTKKLCLILGNEVTGVDERLLALTDVSLEIPQYGTKHSLNVSVAAGIALHSISCQMSPAAEFR